MTLPMDDRGLPLPRWTRFKSWDDMTDAQRERLMTFVEYLRSEVCELDLADGPTEDWADRPWDLSKRLDAGTIKWLECGGDINA